MAKPYTRQAGSRNCVLNSYSICVTFLRKSLKGIWVQVKGTGLTSLMGETMWPVRRKGRWAGESKERGRVPRETILEAQLACAPETKERRNKALVNWMPRPKPEVWAPLAIARRQGAPRGLQFRRLHGNRQRTLTC